MSEGLRRRVVDALPPMTATQLKHARRFLGTMWDLGGPISELEMATMLGFTDRTNYRRYEREGAEATGPMSTAIRAMLSGYRPPNAPQAD